MIPGTGDRSVFVEIGRIRHRFVDSRLKEIL